MSTPTFESEALILWQQFVAFTNDPNNSDQAVIAAEKLYDEDYEELCLKFSHPPGRPNRRR